ncbi:MAG: hypothetical protein J6J79_06850 [Lachnospiraceae bacterium]|nr:hypothetical protein [Lachnospiraceae bacterium]
MTKETAELTNGLHRESNLRPLEELDMMDSFLFEAATEDVENAKKIARVIIERAVGHRVENLIIESQKSLKGMNVDKRGIRMDLYSTEQDVLGEGRIIRIYDIEPNNYYEKEIPRRNRFYQSLIDAKLLPKGADFKKMPDVITIWILPYDPFGDDRMIYTVKNVVAENEELSYDDGVCKIFLYTKGNKGGSFKLKSLLTYMEDTRKENAVDEELLQIQSIVDEVKCSDEERKRYMNLFGVIDYEKRDSFDEGHELGVQEGIINTCKTFGADRARTKEELLKNFDLTEEKAEELLRLYW